jgi:hypothetical protein
MKISQPLSRVKASAELDQLVLELFMQHGELTKPRLAQLTGGNKNSFQHCLPRLIALDLIHSVRIKNRMFYRLGKASNQASNGRSMPQGTYTGEDLNTAFNRPGCLDFLEAPSLMGDKRIPYRPPMHGCVSTASNLYVKT